jgi:hypothetical protein
MPPVKFFARLDLDLFFLFLDEHSFAFTFFDEPDQLGID